MTARTMLLAAFAVLGLVFVSTSRAATEDDKALLDALTAELDRSVEELTLPGAPPLYHLRYQLITADQVDATASFGALVQETTRPNRELAVEVRVGSAQFDNTGFGGFETGTSKGDVPDQMGPHAVRQLAWSLTDTAYKDAVEQYARKTAVYTPPPDHPGDFELRGPTTADVREMRDVQAEHLVGLARDLSAVFPAGAGLELAEVQVSHATGSLWTLDSEGTRVLSPYDEASVFALAHLRCADGMLLTDHRRWIVRTPDQLPGLEEMALQVREMVQELTALRDSPPLDEEYVGPVLFEEDAAVDLFRYLLTEQLEGTPKVIPFDTFLGDLGNDLGSPSGLAFDVRVGRRVLPPGWAVLDDPRLDLQSPAAFRYDSEGTPAQQVALVDDGIVRTLLMSRIPRKGIDGSNGHARSWPGKRLAGRVAMMQITPDKRLQRKKVRNKALQLAKAYGRDHVLVVRRLQDPPVREVESGPSFFFAIGMDEQAGLPQLPMPVSLVRLYSDGREEIVRGAAFAGVHRWVLRDITAAGPQVESTWFTPFEPGGQRWSPAHGMPVYLSAPEVLVGEMELVPVPGDPRDCRVIPPPSEPR